MSISLAQDAIALLIDLADRGEIDPWDVQVIEVIDRYLSRLIPTPERGTRREFPTDNRGEREIALSQSGQAFLYAAMLVLLKADSLVRSELAETEVPGESEAEEYIEAEILEPDSAGPIKLERQLRRRPVAPVPKKRKVTLQELIEQLQVMSVALETYQSRPKARSSSSAKSKAKTAGDLQELANQDNLSEVAAGLDKFLGTYWPALPEGRDWLNIEELVEGWTTSKASYLPVQPNGAANKSPDLVGVFWALLLLSAQSKVELAQEEFYQDLKIRVLPASA